jgi:hypothetical protein
MKIVETDNIFDLPDVFYLWNNTLIRETIRVHNGIKK